MDEQVTKRRHAISSFESYEIYEHELITLETGHSSHQSDLTFFSIAVTVFLCFFTVWVTMPAAPVSADGSPLSPLTRQEQYYFLAMISSLGMAAYLGFRWWQSSATAVSVCRVIRTRAAGPMGDDAKPLAPGASDTLPSTQAPSQG